MTERDAQAGFTLVELLVTVGITMIALAGLLSLSVTLTRGNALAGQNAEAISMVQARIEQLRNTQIDCSTNSSVDEVIQGRNTSFIRTTIITPIALFAGDNTTCRLRVQAAWLENRNKLPDNGDPALILGESNSPTFHSIGLEVFRSSIEGS